MAELNANLTNVQLLMIFFISCVKEELHNKQLIRMSCVPKHYCDRADSECVLCVGVDDKGVEFTGNKHTYIMVPIPTDILYIYIDHLLAILIH